MKKIIFTIMFVFGLYVTMMAQEKAATTFHQVGLVFNNLYSFGFNYKYGNEKTRFRASVLSIGAYSENNYGREQDSIDDKQSSLGAGLTFGFEKSKSLYKDFSFIWGLEISGRFNTWNHETTGTPSYKYSSWTISPGINAIAGLEYILKGHWVFGAEITPGISYSYGKTKRENNGIISQETTVQNFHFNLTNGGAGLSVAYRF